MVARSSSVIGMSSALNCKGTLLLVEHIDNLRYLICRLWLDYTHWNKFSLLNRKVLILEVGWQDIVVHSLS